MRRKILQEERKLWKKGYKKVACLDESGRGPLAGPVIAAAVMISSTPCQILVRGKIQNLEINDSKKLTAKKREEFYKILTGNPAIKWGIGRVSEKVIDRINILEATKLAMIKAIKKLERKPDFLIIDGNFNLNLPIPQKSIVKADEKVFSCMVSSIIAKVFRDRIMEKLHKKYPYYAFNRHKGYPTKFHFKMLKKHGSSKVHRKTFGPLKRFF